MRPPPTPPYIVPSPIQWQSLRNWSYATDTESNTHLSEGDFVHSPIVAPLLFAEEREYLHPFRTPIDPLASMRSPSFGCALHWVEEMSRIER
jgi:hypothetical protein